ncbi:MAG: tRNA uridine-5-carboxymethylaminomethyl(34) synthesis GTPase MnmE [Capsulimonadales bacterium]|nr:tRNA uridine-5-carboxymethylaminomethyl(34) synthesis GTPase MnmE [Capsulimonadales bacterium]
MKPEISRNDTIVAIATPVGPAGVGILRLSGPQAFVVADRLTREPTPLERRPPRTLHRTRILDPDTGETLDDGLIVGFPAPRSFTGEHVVEFHGHGGTVNLTRLLHAFLTAGARIARPGEFSERAFLHGKLDLAQAEAIADMIAAGTVDAQRAARRQLSGELSAAVRRCADLLRTALAYLEASIDFPDDVGDPDVDAISALLRDAREAMSDLLRGANYGRRLREGITVVLTGRPNVGKSSLLNALSGTDRAIVTPLPGTTRDIVEEQLNLAGIPVRALDTAGLRRTDDPVERIGVERARRAAADADVVVGVLDASSPISADDLDLLSSLSGRPVVLAINKSDCATPDFSLPSDSLPWAAIPVSARTGQGLPELAHAIAAAATAGESETGVAPLVTSIRHERSLREARTSIERGLETLESGGEPELVSVDLFAALSHLGAITGETAREEIIAGIFARFCIGK